MCTSYAMMASSVTPPAKEKGVEVDGVIEAGGTTICNWGCLEQSCAKLHLTVVTSMAYIKEKWGDLR